MNSITQPKTTIFLPLLLTLCCLTLACPRNHSNQTTHQPTPPSPCQYPPTLQGAKQLLQNFLKPNLNHTKLFAKLRPKPADFSTITSPKADLRYLERFYEKLWQNPPTPIRRPNETILTVWKTTISDIQQGQLHQLPTKFKKITHLLAPNLKIYSFAFSNPKQNSKTIYHGLIYTNGCWRLFPQLHLALR